MRDAFISDLQSLVIRQCLLENKMLDLVTMYEQAKVLALAQKIQSYSGAGTPSILLQAVTSFD